MFSWERTKYRSMAGTTHFCGSSTPVPHSTAMLFLSFFTYIFLPLPPSLNPPFFLSYSLSLFCHIFLYVSSCLTFSFLFYISNTPASPAAKGQIRALQKRNIKKKEKTVRRATWCHGFSRSSIYLFFCIVDALSSPAGHNGSLRQELPETGCWKSRAAGLLNNIKTSASLSSQRGECVPKRHQTQRQERRELSSHFDPHPPE